MGEVKAHAVHAVMPCKGTCSPCSKGTCSPCSHAM